MKITFISIVDELSGISSRLLSSYVRSLGHESKIVFLPTPTAFTAYSRGTLNKVIDIVGDSDIVGISVITNLYYAAAELSKDLHEKTGVKIIWGGMHAAVRPRECLEHADWVCVGEGERVLRSVLDGEPISQISGLWQKEHGAIKDSSFSGLVEDISALPYQDFSFNDHYYINPMSPEQSGLLTRELYRRKCSRTYEDRRGVYRCFYKTMTSRGCPFACAYCNNSVHHAMYTRKHYRERPLLDVVEELRQVCRENNFIKFIVFADDSFFSRGTDEIVQFGRLYKKTISLPFKATAIPSSVSEEKLEALIDAGLCSFTMGIESGSPAALRRYNRAIKPETMLNAAKILHRYKDRIAPPIYDIICNDPLSSVDEQRENIRFISTIPKPRTFIYYNLTFFPGTRISEYAVEHGLRLDEHRQGYKSGFHFRPSTSYDILLLLLDYDVVPNWIVRLFLPKLYYTLGARFPLLIKTAYKVLQVLHYLRFAVNRVAAGDWARVRDYYLKLMRIRRAHSVKG